jgi:hypothetical protein
MLGRMRARAIEARRHGDDASRELTRAYANLLHRLHGPQAMLEWLQPLLGKRAADPQAEELAVAWALESDELETARSFALRRTSEARPLPASQRLGVAVASRDTAQIATVLSTSRNDLSRQEQIDAELNLGELNRAAAAARDAMADPRVSEPEAESIARETSELLEKQASGVQLEYRLDTLGPLMINRGQVRASTGALLPLALQFRAGFADLRASDQELLVTQQLGGTELQLEAGGAVEERRGETSFSAGVSWRPDSTMPFARLAQRYNLSRRVEGTALLALQEIVDESPALRVVGARSRAAAMVDVEFTQREYATIVADYRQYRTRDFSMLGQGGAAEVEVGHRLLLGAPGVTLRLQGSVGGNRLVGELPAQAAAFYPGFNAPVTWVVPAFFGSVGPGVAVWSGTLRPTSPLGSLAWRMDAWLGYMTPPNRFAYELRGSLAVALGTGALMLYADYASDRATAAGEPYLALGLNYALSFLR